MKNYYVYLKSNHSLNIPAHKFEIVGGGSNRKITFYKSETEPDKNIAVKFYDILMILPEKEKTAEEQFRLYFKDERTFDVSACRFETLAGKYISFFDADNQQLTDVFADYAEVVAVIPL